MSEQTRFNDDGKVIKLTSQHKNRCPYCFTKIIDEVAQIIEDDFKKKRGKRTKVLTEREYTQYLEEKIILILGVQRMLMRDYDKMFEFVRNLCWNLGVELDSIEYLKRDCEWLYQEGN